MNARCSQLIVSAGLIVVLALALVPLSGAQDSPGMPLAEPGPYGVGEQKMTFVDASRDGRTVSAVLWYPAHTSAASYAMPKSDAEPDATGAPYPLIIYTHALWNTSTLTLGEYLASHGYVVARIYHPERMGDPEYATDIIDRPLDVLFVLNELAALSNSELAGMIDTDHVGVVGYSFGGMTALWTGGARIDPAHLRSWCAENEPDAEPNAAFSGSSCESFLARWDQITAYHSQVIAAEDAELWLPLADERISAVVAVNPCFYPLLGEEGASAATLPTLIVYPESDEICVPPDAARLIYDHLGSSERYLMTMLDGASHTTVVEYSSVKPALRQVTVAFFGYYLQGQEDYAQYLTEEYMESLPSVAWKSSLE